MKCATGPAAKGRNKLPAVVRLTWGEIPKKMREEVAKMNRVDLSEVDGLTDDGAGGAVETAEAENQVETGTGEPTTYSSTSVAVAPSIYRLGRPKRTKNDSTSTSRSVSSISTQSTYPDDHTAPVVVEALSSLHPEQSAYEGSVPSGSEFGSSWTNTWGAATHVDDLTLQIALEQHYSSHPFDQSLPPRDDSTGDADTTVAGIAGDDASPSALIEPVEERGNGSSCPSRMATPEPLYTIHERPAPDWQPSGETFWIPPPHFDYAVLLEQRDQGQGEVWQEEAKENSPVSGQTGLSSSTIEPGSEGGGQVETVVAAESLLDLHSTPARADDFVALSSRDPSPRPAPFFFESNTFNTTAESASSSAQSQSASSAIRGLLEAPEITPRPRYSNEISHSAVC